MNIFESQKVIKKKVFTLFAKFCGNAQLGRILATKITPFLFENFPASECTEYPNHDNVFFPTSKHLKGGLRECFRLSVTRFSVKSHKP